MALAILFHPQHKMTMDSIMLLYWLVYLGTTYYRAKTMCSKLLKLFQSSIFPSFQSLSRFSSVIIFLYALPSTKCYLRKCRSNTARKKISNFLPQPGHNGWWILAFLHANFKYYVTDRDRSFWFEDVMFPKDPNILITTYFLSRETKCVYELMLFLLF